MSGTGAAAFLPLSWLAGAALAAGFLAALAPAPPPAARLGGIAPAAPTTRTGRRAPIEPQIAQFRSSRSMRDALQSEKQMSKVEPLKALPL